MFDISGVKFDEKGLVPAIAQNYFTGEVLMMAYMNREALEKTLSTGKAHYFSRSRNKLWLKGETSGNFQEIKLSLVSQYSFIKNSSAKEVKALVGGSRIYFSFLLIICFIALVLNVFIEIKKQHPHVIASALGMICLLTILILI